MPCRYEVSDSVALITLDRPPVNSFDIGLRRDLDAALRRALADDAVAAIVVTGGTRIFSAGADIEEFAAGLGGDTFVAPTLPDVIALIEAAPKPVIAAIAGVCMGGGLELALGCHYRVAAPNAKFALPEVTLGVLPGAGGTQRLPRAIGVEAALDMIVSGSAIDAAKAVALGLATAGEGDLVAAARMVATQAAAASAAGRAIPRLSQAPATLPAGVTADVFFAERLARLKRALPAPKACVEAVRAAVELPLAEGRQREWALFKELVVTTESKALQYSFFSERAAARIADLPPDTVVRPVETLAIVGAGTMGGGIAMSAINAGLPVILVEQNQEALDRGMATIRRNYESTVKKGRMTVEEMGRRLSRISPTVDFAAIAPADLVIEAVFEDLGVKEKVFHALDGIARPGAILASNTSTLDVDKIAAFTGRPQDVVGLHFFSPANVMRLLEIVRGGHSAPDVLATAMGFAKRIGKVGVIAGVCDGFIGNRMFEEYLRQAYFLLDEGAMPWQVDRALEEWGMAMGPFATMDLAGNDIGLAIRKRRAIEQPDRPYSKIPDRVAELGRYGQKTGAGYYRYDPATRARATDPEIEKIVLDYSKEIGLERRTIADSEIVSRCILALANEGAALLAEGIAQRASDIDVVYRTGYGFPAHRGGPMFHADTIGLSAVVATMEGYRRAYHGEFWAPAPLLQELAALGERLIGA